MVRETSGIKDLALNIDADTNSHQKLLTIRINFPYLDKGNQNVIIGFKNITEEMLSIGFIKEEVL